MHLLIFEPRTQGHHLTWLRYVAEDFLSAGFRLTLAVDYRRAQQALLHETLGELLTEHVARLHLLSALDEQGHFVVKRDALLTLSELLRSTQADDVFLTNCDEIASRCLRRLALGWRPPANLRGHLNGIYFRPRFLSQQTWQQAFSLKASGFRKALQQGWINRLWLLDEYLHQQVQSYAENTFYHLPDPWHGDFSQPQPLAREHLQLPPDARIVLCYGLMTPRKGLRLLTQVLLEQPDAPWFLLCAGRLADPAAAPNVHLLQAQGRALVLDRYLTEAEEALCFAACDLVALPYLQHFGSSGVLSRAAAAGKPVVGADSGLLGQRIRTHGLGWTFRDGNPAALQQALQQAARSSRAQWAQLSQAGLEYAAHCSRSAYRQALLCAYNA